MKTLLEKLRHLKYGYLVAQGSEGGYCDHFVEDYLSAWVDNEENLDWLQNHVVEGFKALARKSWGEKLSSVSDKQLSIEIDGQPAPVELRYRDRRPSGLRVKGGYITVLTEVATIKQFFMAWEEVQRNANAQINSASEMYTMYEWLVDRANGNEEMFIADVIC